MPGKKTLGIKKGLAGRKKYEQINPEQCDTRPPRTPTPCATPPPRSPTPLQETPTEEAAEPSQQAHPDDIVPHDDVWLEEQRQPDSKRRRVVKSVHLTKEQEDKVIEFISSNEDLFNIKRGGYRMTDKKKLAWDQFAQELGVLVDDLWHWYRQQRTQLSKLKIKIEKSGAGSMELTDRQKWQWEKFQFLIPHIKHKANKRQLISVSTSTFFSKLLQIFF